MEKRGGEKRGEWQRSEGSGVILFYAFMECIKFLFLILIKKNKKIYIFKSTQYALYQFVYILQCIFLMSAMHILLVPFISFFLRVVFFVPTSSFLLFTQVLNDEILLGQQFRRCVLKPGRVVTSAPVNIELKWTEMHLTLSEGRPGVSRDFSVWNMSVKDVHCGSVAGNSTSGTTNEPSMEPAGFAPQLTAWNHPGQMRAGWSHSSHCWAEKKIDHCLKTSYKADRKYWVICDVCVCGSFKLLVFKISTL